MGPEGGKPMTWADVSLREFQDALASSAPTPGGGSAACLLYTSDAADDW